MSGWMAFPDVYPMPLPGQLTFDEAPVADATG